MDITEAITTISEKIENELEAGIRKLVESILSDYPEVEGITWSQFTNSCLDTESCETIIYNLSAVYSYEEEGGSLYEEEICLTDPYFGVESYYGTRNWHYLRGIDDDLCIPLSQLEVALQGIRFLLQEVWGENVRVMITRSMLILIPYED